MIKTKTVVLVNGEKVFITDAEKKIKGLKQHVAILKDTARGIASISDNGAASLVQCVDLRNGDPLEIHVSVKTV